MNLIAIPDLDNKIEKILYDFFNWHFSRHYGNTCYYLMSDHSELKSVIKTIVREIGFFYEPKEYRLIPRHISDIVLKNIIKHLENKRVLQSWIHLDKNGNIALTQLDRIKELNEIINHTVFKDIYPLVIKYQDLKYGDQ